MIAWRCYRHQTAISWSDTCQSAKSAFIAMVLSRKSSESWSGRVGRLKRSVIRLTIAARLVVKRYINERGEKAKDRSKEAL
jgi:hypothetical protein